MYRRLLLLALAALALVGPASAALTNLDATAGLGVHSAYVFRGAKYAGWGLQGDVGVGYQLTPQWRVDGTLWGYYELDNPASMAETDYILSTTYSPKSLYDVELGYIYYDVQQALIGPDSQEVYAGVTFNVPFSPALYVYQDFDQYVGTYVEASAAYTQPLYLTGWDLDLNAHVGFQFGQGIDSWNDALLRTAVRRNWVGGLDLGLGLDWWVAQDELQAGNFRVDPFAEVRYSRAF